jgi:all-trans-retinol 13,14-reductase
VTPIDVAVIGAGIGGLSCAARLAAGGLDVTVVEAQPTPGGLASCFSRGAYRFDASLHLLDAVGPGGANRCLLEELGIEDRLELTRPDLLRREIWPHREIDVPQGMPAYIEALAGHFPHSRGGIEELATLAHGVHDDFRRDREARIHGRPPPQRSPRYSSLMTRTVSQALADLIEEPRTRTVAGMMSCYLGLPATELAAIPFLSMMYSYHAMGGFYLAGGSQALSDALAGVLVERGGCLLTERRVERIDCRHGEVRGVVLEDGETLPARHVVSNLSPALTASTLIDPDQVAPRALARLGSLAPSTSVYKVWLGLDHDPAELASLAYETMLRSSYGEDNRCDTVGDCSLVAQHLLDPTCCPPGAGVLSITLGTEAGDEPGTPSVRGERIAREVIDRLDRTLLPHLARHVTEQAVATPATFARLAGVPGGAIHGFRPTPAQSGPRRPQVTTSVARLVQVGGWTYAGSGVTAAMASGLIGARVVLTERRLA